MDQGLLFSDDGGIDDAAWHFEGGGFKAYKAGGNRSQIER
jgi:hypothetical protein